jgi:hypothetical protein
VHTVIEGPVIAEGDQCVPVILATVFSILVILCFFILLFIMRKKLVKCLHYAPVRPRSYPVVSGKFGAVNNIFYCFQKVFFFAELEGQGVHYRKLFSLICINSTKAGFQCTHSILI